MDGLGVWCLDYSAYYDDSLAWDLHGILVIVWLKTYIFLNLPWQLNGDSKGFIKSSNKRSLAYDDDGDFVSKAKKLKVW